MSWKKFGGIKQYDKHKSIHVQNVVADTVTLQERYVGNFEISQGSLSVTDDINVEENLNVGGDIRVKQDTLINRNLSVQNNVTISNDLLTENDATFVEKIYFENNSNPSRHFIYGDASGIGINVTEPEAILDISGNVEKVLQVHSTRVHTRNIMTENVNNYGIAFEVDNSYASIDFYHKTNQNDDVQPPEATIQYDPYGSELLFSMGNQVHLKSKKVYISSSNTTDVSNPENASLLVQYHENPSTKYLPHVFQEMKTNSGTSAHFISSDISSSTFLSMTTKNDIGWQWGGGMDADATGREMGTTGFTDNVLTNYFPNEKRYIPAHTYLTGSSLVQTRTTTGINTYKPQVDTHVLDINGPTRMNHEEIHVPAMFDFEIDSASFAANEVSYGIIIGTPTSFTLSGGFYTIPICETTNGGKTWNFKYDV